ncbi:MAG TPA: hypothetical protein VMT89_14270 [Candidatus Acidoferrales bacterium]|nr:hypothetical protein [Candidatus Acidoferrales bacterium]
MEKWINLIAVVVLSCLAFVGRETTGFAAQEKTIGGAKSVDALLDQFTQALSVGDEGKLHKLRVTENEYRNIIIPGSVKPGEPLRQVADEPSQWFWSMLNQKSEDIGRQLISQYKGHKYERQDVSYTKGTRQFANYVAHGDVRLRLKDEKGTVHQVVTGTIAEIDGHYKFIGFNTNN